MNKKKERLYRIWRAMRERCRREKNTHFAYYGGRGIRVCAEWENYNTFKEWAIANGYSDDLTIDRIDNNGNYCPENCRWATREQQTNNQRRNHIVTYKGESHTVSEWSKITGISYRTILSRINRDHWPLDEVFVKKTLSRDKKTGRYISKKEI